MKSQGMCGSLEPLFLTILRVTVGVIMIAHGWDKLQDIALWTNRFEGMGIPFPKISVYLAIAGELGGGAGLFIGLLTPLAALGIASTMAVAILKVHLPNGLLAKNNGFEYPLTLFAAALYFIFRGAGPISIDGLFCRKKECHSGESI